VDSGAPSTAPALEHAGAPAAHEPEPKRARVTLNNYFTSRASSILRVESQGASAGVLFCKACKEGLVNTTAPIKQHVNTKKHETALKKLQSSSDGDSTRAELLSEYFKVNPQVAQSTVPHDVQVSRMRVVEGCMQAGIALAKLDILRHVIERADKRLTDSSHLRASACSRC